MADFTESKDDDWEDSEDEVMEDFSEPATVMNFSDFVEPGEKQIQKHRITELRRRAEERQDWKRITGEFELDLDELREEA